MAKLLYGVRNGNNIIGCLWENEKLGKVFVSTGELIDLNHDLEIRNAETMEDERVIDLKEFLLECLPIRQSEKWNPHFIKRKRGLLILSHNLNTIVRCY